MSLNILLLLMIISYIIPIIIVFLNFKKENKSISRIITNSDHSCLILICMILMGFFTLLYEYYRENRITLSFIFIISLLIGIYGVILINVEIKIHYIFAAIVFISILGFMIEHCCLTKNNLLIVILILQILFSIMIFTFKKQFLAFEALIIANFAVFFLYLHLISKSERILLCEM